MDLKFNVKDKNNLDVRLGMMFLKKNMVIILVIK